jgi:hypothetical protein
MLVYSYERRDRNVFLNAKSLSLYNVSTVREMQMVPPSGPVQWAHFIAPLHLAFTRSAHASGVTASTYASRRTHM